MSLMRLPETHRDGRGALTELWRNAGGQVTLVEIAPGQTRGCHRHPSTNEQFVFLSGRGWLHLELQNDGVKASLAVGGDLRVFDIPAGRGHAVEAGPDEPLGLLYWSDQQYDADDPDVEPWPCGC